MPACASIRLPKGTIIVYKVPALAAADEPRLSQPEEELRRYNSQDFVDVVRRWPSVEEVSVGPDVSLPHAR